MPPDGVQTGPDALRRELHSAELAVAGLRPGADRQRAVELLRCLDRIDQAVEHLGRRGIDLRAERARIETLHNTTLQKSQIIAHVLADDWDKLRAEEEATRPRWWWYLDEREVTARVRRIRRMGWILGGAGLLLGAITAVYLLFLRPDEAVRRRVALVAEAEGLTEAGSYTEALALYQQAAQVAPDDAELYVAIGALNEITGQAQAAEEAYARAEARYGDEARYWAERSGRYLVLGRWAAGEQAALKAIELDPELAVSYCHLGSAYEAQGRIEEAITAVRACGKRARQQGQAELYVLSASRLAVLLQGQ